MRVIMSMRTLKYYSMQVYTLNPIKISDAKNGVRNQKRKKEKDNNYKKIWFNFVVNLIHLLEISALLYVNRNYAVTKNVKIYQTKKDLCYL